MNLTYIDGDVDKIAWKINASAVKHNYHNVIGYENNGIFEGNIMVLQGEKSHKWDLSVFKKNFPKITVNDIKIVEKAGK
jgi:hypothetical protein